MPESGSEYIEEAGDLLQRLAQESRQALVLGHNSYHLEDDPLQVASSRRIGENCVYGPVPNRGFGIERGHAEYRQKLGMDPVYFIRLMTQGRGPHIVFEWGPGLGRALAAIQSAILQDPELRSRDISCFSECDQFYFKVTVLLKSLFNKKLDSTIETIYGRLDSADKHKIKKEFTIALTFYLIRIDAFSNRLASDVDYAVRKMILTREIWDGLGEAIQSKQIPDLRNSLSDVPYTPHKQMCDLFRAFLSDPVSFFHEPSTDRVYQRPDVHFGIRTPNIILGTDMRNFVNLLPDESVSAFLDVRSAQYIARDAERHRDIVPFGLQIAQKLRPGGGWIGDWPRGNFDAEHHVAEAIKLRHAIHASAYRDRVKLFLIWGPSEEFPEQFPCIPASAVLLKKDMDGRFPIDGLKSGLIRQLRLKDGRTVPASYRLQCVADEDLNAYNTAMARMRDSVAPNRRRVHDELQRALDANARRRRS